MRESKSNEQVASGQKSSPLNPRAIYREERRLFTFIALVRLNITYRSLNLQQDT